MSCSSRPISYISLAATVLVKLQIACLSTYMSVLPQKIRQLQVTDPDAYRKVSASRSEKGTGHRRHYFRQTRDGHGNVPAAGDFTGGGIKALPPRAGQIHLRPGVSRAAAPIHERGIQVAADEARGETEKPCGFHEQVGKVATGADAARERLESGLDSRLLSHLIGHRLVDSRA